MSRSTAGGITLVIIGVLLIVVGASMVVTGQNQMEAEDEWDQEHCTYNHTFGRMTCPENPYEGGQGQFYLLRGT